MLFMLERRRYDLLLSKVITQPSCKKILLRGRADADWVAIPLDAEQMELLADTLEDAFQRIGLMDDGEANSVGVEIEAILDRLYDLEEDLSDS